MNPLLTFASTTPKGLDYGFLALVVAVLALLGGAWIFVNKRLSQFNTENLDKKKNTQDTLNENIYKDGTAPLILTVGAYVSEQARIGFTEDELEVISRYEDVRTACIDPSSPSFVNLSNFAELVEYEQKMKALIDAHSAIDEHNKDYKNMRGNLKVLSIVCWIPISIIAASMLVHFASYFIFKDTGRWDNFVQTSFAIGLISSLAALFFYIKYSRCVKKLDNYTKEADDE